MLLAIFGLLSHGSAAAQAGGEPSDVRIVSGEDVRVSVGEGVVHIEPHLAAHPADPSRLVVAAMTLPRPGDGFRIRIYRSSDAGETWAASPLGSREPGAAGAGIDPWLAYGPDGRLYLAKLPGEVWRSEDDGATWLGPVALPRGDGAGYDAPRMTVDGSGRSAPGRVYVSMMQSSVPRAGGETGNAVAVLRSTDGAGSFLGPEHIAMSDVGKRHGDLTVLPDGTLVVTLHDLFHEGDVLASPRLWSVRSADGGRTFSAPSLITDRFLALSPMLAVDRSDGPRRGRLYAAWMGLGGDRNRYIAYTDDAGDRWSDPTRITQLPDSTRHPTAAVVAVAADGTVGVMWAENVVEDGPSCFEYRFAASVDGGESFTRPVPVSDTVACSDTPAHRVVMESDGPRQATVLERFPQGGDYFGLVPIPGGGFQAVWPDARAGVFQLWTDRIRVVRDAGP